MSPTPSTWIWKLNVCSHFLKKLFFIDYYQIPFLLSFVLTAESPELTGRIIARTAMETREELLNRSGRTIIVADAANSLGICDIDGRSPISFRSYK